MKITSVLAMFLAAAVGVSAVGATLASSSKRVVVNTMLAGKDLSRTTAAIGDVPDHEIAQRVYSYRITSEDKDFDGFRTENFAQTDTVAGKGTHRGYGVWKNKAGEEIHVRFDGEHHPVDGGNTKFTGKVDVTGGTGKFAHISGTGTYSGTITATEQTSQAVLDVSY